MRGTDENVLYLDFDGVLHNHDVWWSPRRGAYIPDPSYRLFEHLGLLEQLLKPYPDVCIVLSTSWVRKYGFSKSAKLLGYTLCRRAIGATFHSEMDRQIFEQLSRGRQVIADVERRKPDAWLALDDDDEGWPASVQANYLKTHNVLGLSDPDTFEAARARLSSIFGGHP